ncbi:MAG: hypothetical protein R3F61_20330 [Myxococcota bacterium]
MNASSPLADAVLTEAVWVIGAGVIGLIATAAVIVMMVGRRRVPPVLGVASVGLMALAALGGGLGGLYNPDLFLGTLASGLVHLLAAFAAVPLAGLLLLGTVVIALRDPPRQRGLPAVVAALVLVTVAATYTEGLMTGSTRFGAVRAVIVAGMGVMTVITTLSDAEDARDATIIAGTAFAVFVGLVETAERGMALSMSLSYTCGIVEYAKRPEGLTQMLGHVAPAVPWAWASTLSALSVGLVTLGWTLRSRGMRAGDLAVLGWLALTPALLVVGMPQLSDLTAAAAAGPPPKKDRTPPP